MRRIILATAIAFIIPSISMAETRITKEIVASTNRTIKTAEAIGKCQEKVQGTFKELPGKRIGKINDSYASYSYTNITKNGKEQNVTCGIDPINQTLIMVTIDSEKPIYVKPIEEKPIEEKPVANTRSDIADHYITNSIQYEVLADLASSCKISVKVRGGIKGRNHETCEQFFGYNSKHKGLLRYSIADHIDDNKHMPSPSEQRIILKTIRKQNSLMADYAYIIARP